MDLEKKINETGAKPYYVVRGASIICNFGSAPDVLNMPVSHGVFIKNKPQANVSDSVAGENIICFGVCSKTGAPCVPDIRLHWINQNTTKLEFEQQQALLADANTFCIKGGIIRIITTGQ